jgi:hypothetical protein
MSEENFGEVYRKFDDDYRKFFLEVVRDRHDCRLCTHYSFERSCEVESFDCTKKYFNAVDYGGADRPVINWFGCHGKDFSFNPSTHWWEAIYGHDKDNIDREVKKRIKDKEREEKCQMFKRFILDSFDKKYGDILLSHFSDLTSWDLPPSSREELMEADSIAAFSFGFGPKKSNEGGVQYDPKYFYPGKSNKRMAELMPWFLLKNEKINLGSIFAQWEIAVAFSEMYNNERELRNIAKPEGETYLGTKGVADIFIKQGLGKFRKIAVFAHPLHMYRCVKTLEKSLGDTGSEAKVLIADTKTVPFDERSVHPQTTDIRLWIPYEINSRAYARIRGHM